MSQEMLENGGHPHTAPVSEAPVKASRLDPEFVDCKGLEAGWGIKRSLAYGKIEGVSLRRRNQIRGKRLFKVDSVRAFLDSQMKAVDA